MIPKILACALLVSLSPCLALSKPRYVMQPDTRVGVAYSAKLDGVHSLQACLGFLLANADSHVAVSYNKEKGECIAASVDAPLVFEAESGWTSYKTEATTKNSVATRDDIDINSALSRIQTNYTGSVRLIERRVVDFGALAYYEAYDASKDPPALSWLEARRFCESMGWQLARLVTPSLLEAARQILLNNYNETEYASAAVGGVYNVQSRAYVWYRTTVPLKMDSAIWHYKCVYAVIFGWPGMRLYDTSCYSLQRKFMCSSDYPV